ncbi:MAG: 50S ribosome-binding GTPase, partial [Planctomycetes bacterium]|nr:50S ribosome-binding GTPase [Planctomycetota bacterium]
AHPKIADYPFTTLKPQLGIVELSDHRRFVMADIPGLIEGAHEGAGLGDGFLRHIERTRIILHLVDVGSPYAAKTPVEAYNVIREELRKYSPDLAAKEEVVAANKIDLAEAVDIENDLEAAIGKQVLPISAATGKGMARLAEELWRRVQEMKEPPPEEPPPPEPPHRKNPC